MKLVLLLLVFVFAQSTDAPSPIITAENIGALAPVAAVDFEALPEDIQLIDSGWFAMSDALIAVVRRDGGMVIFDIEGTLIDTYTIDSGGEFPATVLDADFNASGTHITTIHTDGAGYFVAVHEVGGETQTLDFSAAWGRPVEVWLEDADVDDIDEDAADDATPPAYVWVETVPDLAPESDFHVVRLSLDDSDTAPLIQPSAPENDLEAFVRIGRIQPPLAITATPAGIVRLWNLQTGEAVYEVPLETAPVFGRVNETTGAQLTWRDADSEGLFLLDFETGENTRVATLDGAYIQGVMITPAADVVLAVHIADTPNVAAWDAVTGERYDLGMYRTCSRVPDMIQLSRDGRTLVIGCDTGLEMWQIAP